MPDEPLGSLATDQFSDLYPNFLICYIHSNSQTLFSCYDCFIGNMTSQNVQGRRVLKDDLIQLDPYSIKI